VKEEFLANISHELRTPLTAVMGYIQILQEGISGPLTTEQHQDLDQVRSASDRLLGLIDNLLELTTLKRGNLDVTVTEFDAREPIKAAVAATPGRAVGVSLVIDTPEGYLPAMRSDRKKIEKILASLLSNAYKFTEPERPLPAMRTDRKKIVRVLVSLLSNAYKFTERGEVRVSLAVRGAQVRYAVRDTGIGIPTDALPVVFDEFRQADGSFTRRYGGSGLGLALSRRMAQLLGGDIEVTSTPGGGSEFTVELPLEHTSVPVA
jgi:signal transduction histidine kinase